MKILDYKAPFLSYDDIRISAKDFLYKYNPNDTIPVKIDEIIEKKLNMDIIPINGLRQFCHVDGFISHNCKEICVDLSVFERYENRLLFTLAHEIAHMILHKDLFEISDYSTMEEWISFVNSINQKEYSFLEFHANSFAGLVLVPEWHLKIEYEKTLSIYDFNSISEISNEVLNDWVSRYLSDKFNVSSQVILKRLKYDRIIDQY